MTTKQKLHSTCLIRLEERIADLENRIAAIVESRNNETKSSAGDKYETSRAMMQMEEDKVMAQLELAKQMQSELRQLNTVPVDATIRMAPDGIYRADISVRTRREEADVVLPLFGFTRSGGSFLLTEQGRWR